MPLYDYECPKCLKVEEQEHSWKENPRFICSDCHQVMVRVILKVPTWTWSEKPVNGKWTADASSIMKKMTRHKDTKKTIYSLPKK